MTAKLFSEDEVHGHIYKTGLEALILEPAPLARGSQLHFGEEEFSLWKLIKHRTLSKISQTHELVRYGHFIASKLKLPTDNTNPMELDLIGTHENGLFVLELKVNKSAERNSFSELFAYSNYIAGIFAASGRKDITNILVANLDAKITRQAFLYDLLIADRDIIVYLPVFKSGKLDSLELQLHLPSDEDFQIFANELLSHESMSCAVASFEDADGWFDSKEENGSLNDWTKEHLAKLSAYTAQLMEAEGLHGFCFIRKPWQEIPRYYRNSLFVCALNPFNLTTPEVTEAITSQLDADKQADFFEIPRLGFDGRLFRIAKRAVEECLTHNQSCEVEHPFWASIVNSMDEVVMTHNFGFHPTGMFREAYVSHINSIYHRNSLDSEFVEDVSFLKVNEIDNWLKAWEFMEACGFKSGLSEEP